MPAASRRARSACSRPNVRPDRSSPSPLSRSPAAASGGRARATAVAPTPDPALGAPPSPKQCRREWFRCRAEYRGISERDYRSATMGSPDLAMPRTARDGSGGGSFPVVRPFDCRRRIGHACSRGIATGGAQVPSPPHDGAGRLLRGVRQPAVRAGD